MGYNYKFEIMGLPKMANGGHGHWRAEHASRKKWHELVGQQLLGRVPRRPLKRTRVIFTRCSSSEPDFDGLVHGFKPVRDALVKFGVLEDDKPRNLVGEYYWEKAAPKKGRIRVEIEEITDDTQP
jgi:Holliday junction resolvase RusA-like endonuclease